MLKTVMRLCAYFSPHTRMVCPRRIPIQCLILSKVKNPSWEGYFE